MEKNEIGGACSAYGDTGIWWGNVREIDHLENPDIDGRIISRWIFRMCGVGHRMDRAG
jgi:hypothetical protein